jgi:hypothetical protein
MSVKFNADSLKRPLPEIKQDPYESKKPPLKRQKTDHFPMSTISPSKQVKVVGDSVTVTFTNPAALSCRVIDEKHLLGGQDKNGQIFGYHFAPKGSELLPKLKRIVNNHANGVFFARVPDGKGSWKDSSFFPLEIADLQSLTDLLLIGKQIAKCSIKVLYKVERNPAEKSFYYISHLSKNGNAVENCFPAFDFVEVDEISDEKISFGGGLFSKSKAELVSLADEILAELMHTKGRVDRFSCPVRFVQCDDYCRTKSIIIDIAPKFSSQTGVPRGILVSIKSKYLSYFGSAPLQSILDQLK